MLNLTQHRGSPAPGVSVDNEALARQRQMVQAGVNGQHTNRPPAVNGDHVAHPSSSVPSGSPLDSSVKVEKRSTQSPAPQNITPLAPPLTNGMMPPPAVRPPSSSPYPGLPQPSYTSPAYLPSTPLRQYPIEAALLPSVTISTHPQLKATKPFSISIPPHAILSHQSVTLTLPPTHYFLQIQPTISKQLGMNRPYKLFVTVNGTRLTQRDTILHQESGKRTHVYEGSLAQGVNRVEVEVAAAKGAAGGEGLDVEKVGAFVNLLR